MARRSGVVALLALLVLPGPLLAGEPGGYVATDCEHLLARAAGDGLAARRAVPSSFVPLGPPAAAVLVVAAARCDVRVDGGPEARAVFGDVGVLIAPPDASGGLHLYWLWHLTGDPAMHRLVSERGVPAARVAARYEPGGGGVVFGEAAAPLFARGTFTFPWGADAYTVQFAAAHASGHAGAEGGMSWWHQGAAGVVVLRQELGGGGEAHGAALLRAGDRLTDLLAARDALRRVEAEAPAQADLRHADLRAAFDAP